MALAERSSAELSRRRGSLKRRDRSAEKAARAEAAIERKTVNLSDGPMTVAELAEAIDEKPVPVIKFLMTDLGNAMRFDDDDDEFMEEDTALASGFAFEEDENEETLKK
ncbi:hypothetical protein (Partial), partial [Seminavis robusta]|eukprot:Sro3327_g346850.1 n/a (108) ;mRNA; r:2-598